MLQTEHRLADRDDDLLLLIDNDKVSLDSVLNLVRPYCTGFGSIKGLDPHPLLVHEIINMVTNGFIWRNETDHQTIRCHLKEVNRFGHNERWSYWQWIARHYIDKVLEGA